MAREGIHAKLAHEHWTGPWEVTAIEQPAQSYQATLRGLWGDPDDQAQLEASIAIPPE